MKLKTWGRQWLRRNWPSRSDQTPRSNRAAIAIVNFNTGDLLSHLLFSIFRVLDRQQLARVVVVDNASTDFSKTFLDHLRKAGLIDVLFNDTQRYHGPALNQAMTYLAGLRRQGLTPSQIFDYVWILDSDTVVLRPDVLKDAVACTEQHRAGLIGEHQPHKALPEGYAHVSSILVDPEKVWRRSIAPFEESGAPAKELQISLRKQGIVVHDFPFRRHNYILHLGRGTLARIKESRNEKNRYHQWASEHFHPHFHGNHDGAQIHRQFLEVFYTEVPTFSGEALTAACQRTKPLRLTLPAPAIAPGARPDQHAG